MDKIVEKALREPTDRSPSFTAKVARLADRVRQVLGAPVEHVQDMSYANSQRIAVCVDAAGHSVPQLSQESVAKIQFYVSSKANLFAVRVFQAKTPTRAAKEWVFAPEHAEQAPWSEAVQKGSAVLVSAGYRRVSEPVLKEPAPGHLTEMDGGPATVFDVLFAEVE